MGLDMYLDAERYVSGYPHNKDDEKAKYATALEVTGLKSLATEHSPSATISVRVAYWRKANAIHDWFVQNCQNGVDECQRSPVEDEQLKELVETCKTAMFLYENDKKDEAGKLLAPASGFFFGSTEIDEYWYEDLKNTVAQIEPLLLFSDFALDFYYTASW